MTSVSASAVWHDLECGRYEADLPCWRELAGQTEGAILDVGAGAGRVAIDLAGRGHSVTALDRDANLLGELSRRAGPAGARLSTVVADATDFHLGETFGLIIVPMQTIQLLGTRGRARFLGCAVEHLRPGGRLAAAITEQFDLYDESPEDPARLPTPDVQEAGGTVYVSQPTAVRVTRGAFVLERRREILPADGSRSVELHQDRIDSLTAAQLEREGDAVGLHPAGRTEIPATSDHVGSVVVMLDA